MENNYNQFNPEMYNENTQINSDETQNISEIPVQQSFKDMEEIRIDNFSFEGHQVVPAEYFAHRYEPSVTFNRGKIALNTACLRRFPDTDYILIMVNPMDKQMIVKPITEDVKDSFVWRTKSNKPKQISCGIFFGMVVNLMNWNPNYRYKLLGKLINTSEGYIFLFNLSSYEFFPEEWKHRFGLSVEEHKKQLQAIVISDFTIYSINNSDNTRTEIKEENSYE